MKKKLILLLVLLLLILASLSLCIGEEKDDNKKEKKVELPKIKRFEFIDVGKGYDENDPDNYQAAVEVHVDFLNIDKSLKIIAKAKYDGNESQDEYEEPDPGGSTGLMLGLYIYVPSKDTIPEQFTVIVFYDGQEIDRKVYNDLKPGDFVEEP